jgi:hypothetical protein
MRTIAGVAGLVASLALVGCAGTLDCLRNDRDFEAYAERLHLRDLSIEDAAAALVRDGFRCEKNAPIAFEAAIVCTKQCRPRYGEPDRQLFIGLDPSDRGKHHSAVKWGSLTPA